MTRDEKIAELRESSAAHREDIEQRRAMNAESGADVDELLARVERAKAAPEMTQEQRERILDDLRRGAAAQQEMIRRMTEQPKAESDADEEALLEAGAALFFGDRERGEAFINVLCDVMRTLKKDWRADIEALRREIAEGEKVINFADLRRTA
jgi:hypothetical protein